MPIKKCDPQGNILNIVHHEVKKENVHEGQNFKYENPDSDNENLEFKLVDVSNNISEIQFKDEILTKDPLEISNEEFKKTEIIPIKTENDDKKSSVKYKCDLCNSLFDSEITIRDHVKKVHKGTKYNSKCESCDKSFPTFFSLKQHMKYHIHEGLKDLPKCDCCDRSFSTESDLKKHNEIFQEVQKDLHNSKHIKNIHEGLKCDSCEKSLSTEADLKKHIKNVHQEVKKDLHNLCDICKKKFSDFITLKTHMKYFHKLYKCGLCPETLSSAIKLTEHIRLIHSLFDHNKKQSNPKCNSCDKTFSLIEDLKAHVGREHSSNTKSLKNHVNSNSNKPTTNVFYNEFNDYCKKCNNMESSACNFCGCSVCSGKHDPKLLLCCDNCLYFFHLKCLDPPLDEIPGEEKDDWYCSKCTDEKKSEETIYNSPFPDAESTSGSVDVSESSKIESESTKVKKEFKCEFCHKTYASPQSIKEHQQNFHEGFGKIRYKCDSCIKSYTSAQMLRGHKQNVHEGKKSECHICGKFVSYAQNQLRKHIKIMHEGLKRRKNSKCDSCEKSFQSAQLLQGHYEHNIHEKPQKRWSFLLNNHMIWPIPICKGSTGDIESCVQIRKSLLKPLEYQIFGQILCLTLPEIVDLVNIGELRYTTTFT